MRGHGAHQGAGAGIEPHPLGVAAGQHAFRQTLQGGDALAQRGLEVELAAHGSLGDRGHLGLDPGVVGQLVDALAADHGGVHVGQEQALATAGLELGAGVHRQAGARVRRRLAQGCERTGLDQDILRPRTRRAARLDLGVQGGHGVGEAIRRQRGGRRIGADEGDGEQHGAQRLADRRPHRKRQVGPGPAPGRNARRRGGQRRFHAALRRPEAAHRPPGGDRRGARAASPVRRGRRGRDLVGGALAERSARGAGPDRGAQPRGRGGGRHRAVLPRPDPRPGRDPAHARAGARRGAGRL